MCFKITSCRPAGPSFIFESILSTSTFSLARTFERDKTLIKGHQGNTVRKEKGGGGKKGSPEQRTLPNRQEGRPRPSPQEERGGQGGDEGNRAPRYRNTRRLRTTTEAIAARGRGGGRGGHSGCWHPNGASSSLELDVLLKRGKSVSPTKDTFSESFMNGC